MIVERAISLTQPWASLMAIGAKRIETRGWPTKFRGWVAIHAAKGFPRSCRVLCFQKPFLGALSEAGFRNSNELPLGSVVAIANLADCWHSESLRELLKGNDAELAFGDYSDGRYGFMCKEVRRLREPLPIKGALSIWKLPRPITEEMLI